MKKIKYCIWQAQQKPFCKQCNPFGTKTKLWIPNGSPAYLRPYNYIEKGKGRGTPSEITDKAYRKKSRWRQRQPCRLLNNN